MDLRQIKDFQLSTLRDQPGQQKIAPFQRSQPNTVAAAAHTPMLSVTDRENTLRGTTEVHLGLEASPVTLPQLHRTDGPDIVSSEKTCTLDPMLVALQSSRDDNGDKKNSGLSGPSSSSTLNGSMKGTSLQSLQEDLEGTRSHLLKATEEETLNPDLFKGLGLHNEPVPQEHQFTLQQAQEVAARLRSETDVLRMMPRASKDDPNFVDTFYRSSRLHFIGTWKARIEKLLGEIEDVGPAPNPPPPGRPAVLQQGLVQRPKKGNSTDRSIIHIDMDCFFASAAAASHPELRGRPVVVCHSNSAKGTGEVSCANYEARAMGIKADMFIAEAKRLCPDVIVIPYLFEKYQAISESVYRILVRHTSCVQPLSCDEALLDVTGLGDAEEIARRIRHEIYQSSKCTASAGVGPNILVARLATRRGKPNGQFHVPRTRVMEFLSELPVEQLPGVGWSMRSKLEALGIKSVCQLRAHSKEMLQRHLGSKTGQSLWFYAHGIDERTVESVGIRRSVGAECNYGVRCEGVADVERLLASLAVEVSARLKAAGVRGRAITLKLKRRQAGAPEPKKFLGHGWCDDISRSMTVSTFTDHSEQLLSVAKELLTALSIPPEELRGLGIMVGKLDNDTSSHSARPGTSAPSKLAAPTTSTAYDPSRPGYYHPWVHAEATATAGPNTRAEDMDINPGLSNKDVDSGRNSFHKRAAVGGITDDQLVVAVASSAANASTWEATDIALKPSCSSAPNRPSSATTLSAVRSSPSGNKANLGSVTKINLAKDERSIFKIPLECRPHLQGESACHNPKSNFKTGELQHVNHEDKLVEVRNTDSELVSGSYLERGAIAATAAGLLCNTADTAWMVTGAGMPTRSSNGVVVAAAREPPSAWASSSSVAALPSQWCQLDPGELAALPPEIKREIEGLYGVAPGRSTTTKPQTMSRTSTGVLQGSKRSTNTKQRGGDRHIKRQAAAVTMAQGAAVPPRFSASRKPPEDPQNKEQLLRMIPQQQPLKQQVFLMSNVLAPSLFEGISASQVDMQVLAELPQSVQKQVKAQIKAQRGLRLGQLDRKRGLPLDQDMRRVMAVPGGDEQLMSLEEDGCAVTHERLKKGTISMPGESCYPCAFEMVSAVECRGIEGKQESDMLSQLLMNGAGRYEVCAVISKKLSELSNAAALEDAGSVQEHMSALAAACMIWLQSLDTSLDELSKALKMIKRNAEDLIPSIRVACGRLVEEAKAWVHTCYGFELIL
ncbi:hypothetical protein CEUSTIGMA_g3537.t1 [Chlamydomonas eustigma]|uniref:DNA polymerase kappa n=1 Tax=Chlamydomonas eustigma TaxID=1157962 RepID=A0A250WZ23_9CHLO|nr:hypothetical protein CEUSTIGMA_g3537.t1 [Chlamydomonas eustigma]|eukprot:GAX76094.1 hypothetical protein CEUSTIGMA_g3537.t1 [Chlamydomonas eustigma]